MWCSASDWRRSILCGVRLFISSAEYTSQRGRDVRYTSRLTGRKSLVTLPSHVSGVGHPRLVHAVRRVGREGVVPTYITYSSVAASVPTFRGLPGQPEFGMVMTRTCECSAA